MPGTDGRVKPRITCFRCEKLGHFADFCPEGVQEGNTHNIITEEIVEEDINPSNEDLETMQAGEDEGANIEDVEDNDQGDAWVNMMDTWGEDSDESDESLIMSFQLMEIRDKFIRSGGTMTLTFCLTQGQQCQSSITLIC